jgi:hypothetical protein
MTQEQKTELEYLLNVILEASKWKIEDGQDAIRLEIESRIDTILSSEATAGTDEPEVSSVLTEDDYKALEAARLSEHLASPNKVREAKERWKKGRVRVMVDGKPAWKKIEECVKQKCFPDIPDSTKWRWVWKGEQQEEPVAEVSQPVDKLSDELWAEHEKGEE